MCLLTHILAGAVGAAICIAVGYLTDVLAGRK